MKNTLKDLNDYLFEQLEHLTDETESLDENIKRAMAVKNVSDSIISNANTILKAEQMRRNSIGDEDLPELLDAKRKIKISG